jgi:flagellar basal-body rod modification protein FlgD
MSSWGYDSKVAENNSNVAAKLEEQRKKYQTGGTKTSSLGEQADSYKVGTTTSRGTKIVEYGDTGMGKDAFLKLLVAQMTNMDPTQDQDSTAYVTQMAQFASIEQTNNLNDTMSGFSVRNLLGKHVICNQYDATGNPIEGTVIGVQTKSGKNYLSILDSNGKVQDNIDSSKVSGVIESTKDNTGAISALNTQFIAASALKGQRVVVVDEDDDGNTIVIKGKVEGSYIDGGDVKLKINKFDDELNETGETVIYSYLDIYKAGDLSDEDMDVKASDFDDDETESNGDTDIEESNNDSKGNVSDE